MLLVLFSVVLIACGSGGGGGDWGGSGGGDSSTPSSTPLKTSTIKTYAAGDT